MIIIIMIMIMVEVTWQFYLWIRWVDESENWKKNIEQEKISICLQCQSFYAANGCNEEYS